MSKKLQSIRGMHDILPDDIAAWQLLETYLHELMYAYGYTEMRTPIVEKSELFARSIGDVTDIVEKEMYTFEDRNGESLSLRPEGTASCVRAGIEHGFLHNQIQRLWYMGPMFRHERPQKGRYRQFHQLGVEAYGMVGPDIDAEVILLAARLWKNLGLRQVRLQINSLGTLEERTQYRAVLVDYLSQDLSRLDDDSQRRLSSNPLRILDSKNPALSELIENAPSLLDCLGPESKAHFDGVKGYLDAAGIDYEINPRLVRGLDYYSHTVFEWVTDRLGAQGTVCAGGRYDGLVAQLGGKATPAVGFAMGLERLLAMLQQNDAWKPDVGPDLYIVYAGEALAAQAMILAESLRDDLPELSIMCHCGSTSLKSQFKQADRSGADYALILGEEELARGEYSLKSLRNEQAQQMVARQDLVLHLQNIFNFD